MLGKGLNIFLLVTFSRRTLKSSSELLIFTTDELEVVFFIIFFSLSISFLASFFSSLIRSFSSFAFFLANLSSSLILSFSSFNFSLLRIFSLLSILEIVSESSIFFFIINFFYLNSHSFFKI